MPSEVVSKFQGLPIAELIANPLKAACDSQRLLAMSAFEFMTQIGLEKGAGGLQTRLLQFDLERPVQGETSATSKVAVKAPFLGLVPIPSLLIDNVQIDFQMEVTDTATSKDNSSSEASVDVEVNFKFGPWLNGGTKIHGKVSSSRENTRSSNQTAKYQVQVSAHQQPATEGLNKLMDIMAACIEPLPAAQQ